MSRDQEFETIEVVAAMFAARERQAERGNEIVPGFVIPASAKPSEKVYIPNAPDKQRYLASLSSYAKITLGVRNWTDADAEVVTITDEHRAQARTAMDTIINKVMLMVLKGDKFNQFYHNLNSLVEQETSTSRNFGLLAYVPKIADQITSLQDVDQKRVKLHHTSGPIGSIGDKIVTNINIFYSFAMPDHDSVRYEAHDDNGNLIKFFKNTSAKDTFQVGESYRINAKIKALGPDQWSNGTFVNQLFYVRLEQ